jgi:phosphoribosylamine---glycine ligase
MKILVIGSGGREHAIAWKLQQSPLVESLFCAPGNAGTSAVAQNVKLDISDIPAVIDWVKEQQIDLCVVGPEAPLAAGIVDAFRKEGLAIFGPTQAAAQLESSKAFAKDFMQRHGIPTAGYRSFNADEIDEAKSYLQTLNPPYVLKADGLAAGKGVVIVHSLGEAEVIAKEMLSGEKFGKAGQTLVIEEFMTGREISIFVITDGNRFATLAPSQDHKRILDNDLGLNTGGMGAFAPTPHASTQLLADIKIRFAKPVLDAMVKDGTPYTGVLYLGFMLTEDGPKVLEFNCRFGDPETQVVLPLIAEDFASLLYDVARGEMKNNRIEQHDANAVCVVMASSGYPLDYEKGKVISGLDSINEQDEGVLVFHAGTSNDKDQVVTSGGRVMGVTALGEGNDFQSTIHLAYSAVNRIRFDGAYYRTDIGRKALED